MLRNAGAGLRPKLVARVDAAEAHRRALRYAVLFERSGRAAAATGAVTRALSSAACRWLEELRRSGNQTLEGFKIYTRREGLQRAGRRAGPLKRHAEDHAKLLVGGGLARRGERRRRRRGLVDGPDVADGQQDAGRQKTAFGPALRRTTRRTNSSDEDDPRPRVRGPAPQVFASKRPAPAHKVAKISTKARRQHVVAAKKQHERSGAST